MKGNVKEKMNLSHRYNLSKQQLLYVTGKEEEEGGGQSCQKRGGLGGGEWINVGRREKLRQ